MKYSEASPKQVLALVCRLKRTPPVKWNAIFSKMDRELLQVVTAMLEQESQFVTRQAVYARNICNGSSHEKGVKSQNTIAAKLRKNLGYSYPNMSNFTF